MQKSGFIWNKSGKSVRSDSTGGSGGSSGSVGSGSTGGSVSSDSSVSHDRPVRPVMLLWVSIRVDSPKAFRLSLPVPLFIITGIIDTLDDMFCLIKIFRIGENIRFKSANGGFRFPLRYWRILTIVAREMLHEIQFHTGPLDIVDVDAGGKDGKDGKVRVRILLR